MFKGKCEAKLEFPEAFGGSNLKIPPTEKQLLVISGRTPLGFQPIHWVQVDTQRNQYTYLPMWVLHVAYKCEQCLFRCQSTLCRHSHQVVDGALDLLNL